MNEGDTHIAHTWAHVHIPPSPCSAVRWGRALPKPCRGEVATKGCGRELELETHGKARGSNRYIVRYGEGEESGRAVGW